MNDGKGRVELTADGYEKIDARIQKIENLASNGMFANDYGNARYFHIISEARKLRQVLREVLLLIPDKAKRQGGGDAA